MDTATPSSISASMNATLTCASSGRRPSSKTIAVRQVVDGSGWRLSIWRSEVVCTFDSPMSTVLYSGSMYAPQVSPSRLILNHTGYQRRRVLCGQCHRRDRAVHRIPRCAAGAGGRGCSFPQLLAPGRSRASAVAIRKQAQVMKLVDLTSRSSTTTGAVLIILYLASSR